MKLTAFVRTKAMVDMEVSGGMVTWRQPRFFGNIRYQIHGLGQISRPATHEETVALNLAVGNRKYVLHGTGYGLVLQK